MSNHTISFWVYNCFWCSRHSLSPTWVPSYTSDDMQSPIDVFTGLSSFYSLASFEIFVSLILICVISSWICAHKFDRKAFDQVYQDPKDQLVNVVHQIHQHLRTCCCICRQKNSCKAIIFYGIYFQDSGHIAVERNGGFHETFLVLSSNSHYSGRCYSNLL